MASRTRTFKVHKTSLLSPGTHPRCELTDFGEAKGKWGPQAYAELQSVVGSEKGKSIRAYAALEYEGDSIVPSSSNQLGRLLMSIAGIDDIDDDIDIDPQRFIGACYRVKVITNKNNRPKISLDSLGSIVRIDDGDEDGKEAVPFKKVRKDKSVDDAASDPEQATIGDLETEWEEMEGELTSSPQD